jgi:hypothetical protein
VSGRLAGRGILCAWPRRPPAGGGGVLAFG